MDLYSKLKISETAANSDKLDSIDDADLFRDGLYIGNFDIKGSTDPLPVIIPLDRFGAISVLDDGTNCQQVVKFLQVCAYRILASVDPSLCKFILYDRNGFGNGLITFSNLDTRIKGEKILTTPAELNRALEKLTDRAITVIQNVLGSKYANSSLINYNRNAGNGQEPYYFLFIKDFPEGIGNEQCNIIEQLVQSGPKAGIFTFITYSTDHYSDSPYNNGAKSILKHTANIVSFQNASYVWQNIPDQKIYNFAPFKLSSELPTQETLNSLFEKITDRLDQAENITLDIKSEMREEEFWKGDASTGIQVPIGKQNSSTLQYFRLADEINHVLIGGATGFGKSVLLHNIICNVAWRYSPEQVQMILLDYKEGTEFKVYENLPHARVLSIQSEREYGCSVFKFIDEEIQRRGDAFIEVGAQDIKAYNRLSPKILPRMLVIIDEFQKLLDGDARTAAFISASMEDVGRRGRSFGINLILSTQSLMNVNLGGLQQCLGLRIVLHLNTEFDCGRFLSEGNNLPYTTLSRPGQAIYNSRAGLTEGNILFQSAFMDRNDLSETVKKVHDQAVSVYGESLAPYKRFLYDGSTSVEIENNMELCNFREPNDRFCTVFIGEPVALSENHISFKLRRQSGSNILMVGGDENAAMSIFIYSTAQILNQSSADARIVIADKTNSDSPYFGLLQKSFSNYKDKVAVCDWDENISERIDLIYAELTRRLQNRQSGYRIVLILNNIYEIRSLRNVGYSKSEDNKKLTQIIKDGPRVGIHTCIYACSFNNLSQVFDIHEILPECDIKIELSRGNGYRIFGTAYPMEKSQLSDKTENMALMQISDGSEPVKLRIYRNKFS